MNDLIIEDDFKFALPPGQTLLLRCYRSPPIATGQAVVSIHGGAWSKNDRTSAHVLDRALARAGITVFALDFRQGPSHKYPTASLDIAAGVRFVKYHAERFGVDTEVGLLGSSSGGQLALLHALKPDFPNYDPTPIIGTDGKVAAAEDVSAAVSFVAALWPVSSPLARFRYAQGVGRDDLVAGHQAYFPDEGAMEAASIQRILDAREHQHLPPMWIVQPGADDNVPQDMTLTLIEAAQRAGADLKYAFYPGQPHAMTREDTPGGRICIADTVTFIQAHRRTQLPEG